MPNFIVGMITNLQSLKPCKLSTYSLLIERLIFSRRMNFYGTSLRWCFKYVMICIVPYSLPLRAATCKDTLNVAKLQYILLVAPGLKLHWYGIMEWNREQNFSMEWNMEWKIFSMEWKWYEKNCQYGIWKNRIPFHSVHWLWEVYALRNQNDFYTVITWKIVSDGC